MKKLFLVFLLTIQLLATTFKVASYNVENLFDIKYDGSEYKEYIPYKYYWDKKAFDKKLNNIARVIKELNADIISLQEIENKNVLKLLLAKLNYKYYHFLKKSDSAVGLALLSRFPILKREFLKIDGDNFSRYILKTTIKIKNQKFIIYTNHWPSKRSSESKRVQYALKLKSSIDKHSKLQDYIIVGDLNSNYNEFITLKYEKELNDTHNITGINQVLNTTYNGNFIQKHNILKYEKKVHFNPWLELKQHNRFSSKFRNYNITPDHILLSQSLFDNKNISYIPNSFNVFKSKYLFSNNRINRWHHKKKTGFSDHLPIYAYFTTNKVNKFNIIKKGKKDITKISSLYNIETLNKPVVIKDLILLYKTKKIAIFKQLKDRAISFYGNTKNLEYGYKYILKIYTIENYYGTKEIKNIKILSKKRIKQNEYDYFSDAQTIDLFDLKNQNEMITNLTGKYLKRYLYYNNGKKIRIYFKKGVTIPKNNTLIKIYKAHLTNYKSKIQLVIYSNNDFNNISSIN